MGRRFGFAAVLALVSGLVIPVTSGSAQVVCVTEFQQEAGYACAVAGDDGALVYFDGNSNNPEPLDGWILVEASADGEITIECGTGRLPQDRHTGRPCEEAIQDSDLPDPDELPIPPPPDLPDAPDPGDLPDAPDPGELPEVPDLP